MKVQLLLPKVLLLTFLWLGGFINLHAQEVLTPLAYNPQLEGQKFGNKISSRAVGDTLLLPFFDDFSYFLPYPIQSLWLDRKVFVNTTFSVNPPTIGMATFDGLDSIGTPYDQLFDNAIGADTITSRPIDLSAFDGDDSVYLSFYYQAQGLGDRPEFDDSLVLQFKMQGIIDSPWVNVWSRNGGNTSSAFKQIMMPVQNRGINTPFWSGFQMRYMNYGNRSGNLDHWNLDYIYMDAGRSNGDTVYNDLAPITPPRSLLREYDAMPLDQFKENPGRALASEVVVNARNLSAVTKNVTYGYSLREERSGVSLQSTFGFVGSNHAPKSVRLYTTSPTFNAAALPADSARIRIKTAVFTNDLRKTNDTAQRFQILSNYFAYDDGSAEAGYGLINTTSGKVAVKYELIVPDTLRGISISFNRSDIDVTDKFIDLVVWENISQLNQPAQNDKVLARIRNVKPRFGSGRNGFVFYEFEQPIPWNGNVYVGWAQTSAFNLNVGFDFNYSTLYNNRVNNSVFFNNDGTWRATTQQGTPMIRLYTGPKKVVFASLEQDRIIDESSIQSAKLSIYPNPASSQVYIDLKGQSPTLINVYGLDGRLHLSAQGSGSHYPLDIQSLQAGMYMIVLSGKENEGKRGLLNVKPR